jgi:hypothetical protein
MLLFIIITVSVSTLIAIISVKYFPFNSHLNLQQDKSEIIPNRKKLKQNSIKKIENKKRDR